MRKFVKAAALVLALALVLCTTAFAVDAVDSQSNSVTFVTTGDTAYKVMNVSFENEALENGKDYMIWVIAGKADDNGNMQYIPTASSILYIGQAKAENGVFNFNGVYPKEIAHGTVVISGPGMADIDPDGDGLYTLATIYKAGDTDLSGAVDVGDVTKILQHLLTPPDYSGVLGSVSDVDGSGAVDVGDLTKLLQYLVGKTANV